MQHPKELNIGDIVYHKYYGIGQIEDIDKDLQEAILFLPIARLRIMAVKIFVLLDLMVL